MSKRLAVTDSIAFAFGFTWQALDPVESKRAKLQELMAQGNRWKAGFKNNGVEYLGVSKDDFTPLPKIKTLSGAALMANHPKLVGRTVWIVMEEPLSDELPAEDQEEGAAKPSSGPRSEMVVVGLVKGNIVVDDYVDTDGYKHQFAVFVDRCAKAKAKHITVGTSYTLGRVAEQYTWEEFFPNKANKAVHVTTLEPGIYGRVVWGAVIFAAISGLVWGYVAYDNAQKAKAERERREREKRNLPALYTAAVAEILAQPTLRANSAFAELRNQLHSFPLERAGWKLRQVDCQAITADCIATWSNELMHGTNRGFAAAAPKEWGAITFTADGKQATHGLPFKLTTARLPARDTWPTDRNFLLKQFSQWQSYWIVGFHPELGAQPHVIGLVPGLDESMAAALPDAVTTRTWAIAETPWYLSEGFDRSPEKGDANLPDSVTVEHIGVKVDKKDQQMKFEANGAIYENK